MLQAKAPPNRAFTEDLSPFLGGCAQEVPASWPLVFAGCCLSVRQWVALCEAGRRYMLILGAPQLRGEDTSDLAPPVPLL